MVLSFLILSSLNLFSMEGDFKPDLSVRMGVNFKTRRVQAVAPQLVDENRYDNPICKLEAHRLFNQGRDIHHEFIPQGSILDPISKGWGILNSYDVCIEGYIFSATGKSKKFGFIKVDAKSGTDRAVAERACQLVASEFRKKWGIAETHISITQEGK